MHWHVLLEISHSSVTRSSLITKIRLSELFVWSFRISLSGLDALHSSLPVLTVAIQVWIRGELFKSSNLFACVLLHFFSKQNC